MKLSAEAQLVLVSLAEGPKHGYAITQDITRFAGRTLRPGTLYGAIARLESWGYIEALAGDDRRRPYRITARGTKALKESVEDMQRVGATARRRLAPR
ncbi:MAG: PadR family transcriptional regulator [Candidatus Limnocylindria bacterium]